MYSRGRVFLVGLVVGASALLSACGGSSAPGTITVRWTLGFGVACDDSRAQVNTIRVNVVVPGSKKELLSQEFTCSSTQGIVANVPVGTYNLEVLGGVGTGFAVPAFRGAAGGVIVKSGQTVDVGNVVLEKIPASDNPGVLQVTWGFTSGLCGANGVANVRLQVWQDLVFKQHDQTYECDIPAPGYIELNVPPATYGIVAEGLDVDGLVVRRGTKDNVDVQTGQTTNVSVTLQ